MKRILVLAILLVTMSAAAYAVPVVFLEQCYDTATFAQAWKAPLGEWMIVGDAMTDPKNEKLLASTPGEGVAVNGATGRTTSLLTNLEFGDVELTVDFMVSKGSNSGVYFQGRYEVQVLDSFGVANLTHGDCGGIYQRWRDDRRLDDSQNGFEGHAPLTNASKKPGEWQTFRVIFHAPKFDTAGKKTANAKFEKVWLNGVLVQDNVEVSGPTRAAQFNDEKPVGPIMLQGDHGPVAFRNLTIKSLISK